MSGPIQYSSEKVIPWNYGSGVYFHSVKQELSDEDNEEVDPSIVNIAGTSKITRSGRIFSPKNLHLLKLQLPRQLLRLGEKTH